VLVTGGRIQVYLPINTNNERLAARRIVTHLYRHHGGATHSTLAGRTFRGYWYDNERSTLYQDEIAIAWADIPAAPDGQELQDMVQDLRYFSSDQYDRFGSGQLEIWITVEPVQLPA
jgi:hypothetical protein